MNLDLSGHKYNFQKLKLFFELLLNSDHHFSLKCVLFYCTCRFQNKQTHHREQQTERIEREGQRSRLQNTSSGMSGSNGATVSSVNNRVSGLSKARDSRDGDEYARSVSWQSLCRIHCNILNCLKKRWLCYLTLLILDCNLEVCIKYW